MSELFKGYEKFIKETGYNGCRNCKHQIEPLRGCKWLERGGDGLVHLICPKWEKDNAPTEKVDTPTENTNRPTDEMDEVEE